MDSVSSRLFPTCGLRHLGTESSPRTGLEDGKRGSYDIFAKLEYKSRLTETFSEVVQACP